MTDGKRARIVSFSKEQGFGRVLVPDEGELIFDAAALASAVDALAVDTDVFVETGPSRVPGQRKVTRLWRADAPPITPPPPEGAERFESMGPYRVLFPPFWPRDSVNERAPVFTSVAKLNNAQCVLLVYVGGGDDAKAKADFVATRSGDARISRCDSGTPVGISFEGYRFDRDAETELLYLVVAHGDLITVNMRFTIGNTEAEKLAPLLLTMMGAAVIRRGPPAPSPVPNKSESSFWKRLFGS